MFLSRIRVFVVFAVCLTSILFFMPSFVSQETLENKFPSWFPKQTIPLGLDLKGGSSILLEVDLKGFVQERLRGLLTESRLALRKAKVGYTGLKVEGHHVAFHLRSLADRETAYQALRKFGPDVLITTSAQGDVTVEYSAESLAQKERAVIDQSIEIVRRRIDEMGTKEPLIQRQGSDRILVQLPGVADPSEAKALIGKTAKMTFHLSSEGMDPIESQHTKGGGWLEVDEELQRGDQSYHLHHTLFREPFVTGEMLTDAQAMMNNENGGWAVSMTFDAAGAKRFAEVTTRNVGKPFAILLDGKVISAPVINSPITGGSGQITGNFSAKGANDLAVLLRAGALPAPLTVIEERTVGPDLGADSIEMGKHATIVSCLLVFGFMFVFYGGIYGGIANIALFFNLIMLLASLALMQATLTLPGIAGIAITLGMAVDANVLIFERIKEELRHGRRVAEAIEAGFHRAMGTIVDSNLTTVITAGLLYQFGTGPVRGFAVALTVGILISLFTAVTATKTFIILFYKLLGAKSLSFGIPSERSTHANSH